MQDLSRFSCKVNVWRNGGWNELISEELVPGDLFEVDLNTSPICPCDAVLLTGDCIVNESMLTGESLPVSKTPIADHDFKTLDFDLFEPSSLSNMSRFFLFCGTKIIRARGNSGHRNGPQKAKGAIAMVVRTGFNTAKGSLIRSMLFPRPNTFKFYQDAFKFIGVLACISLLGFLSSLYTFIHMNIGWQTILVRALDLITIAVPPALPATMAIGTTFAIRRLRSTDIFCTSPPRVNICGKINMMCFDKTGTLTEEGLDVLGVRFTVSKEAKFENPFDEIPKIGPIRFSRIYQSIDALLPKSVLKPSLEVLMSYSGNSLIQIQQPGDPNMEPDFPYPLLVCALAACHSIKVIDGKLIGDPLELKMFQFTKWHLEEELSSPREKHHDLPTLFSVRPPWVPSQNCALDPLKENYDIHTELCAVKSFDFTSQLRRMSVVLLRNKYSLSTPKNTSKSPRGLDKHQRFDVFVKGAPEVMLSICVPESCKRIFNIFNFNFQIVPPDYEEQLRYYTHHGYRVLAVAWKEMNDTSYPELENMNRSAVESDLRFLGFIIFENKLKPGTAAVVKTLSKANIRQVMCTGDNILTSISVSRECGIIKNGTKVFVPRFLSGEAHEESATIIWEDVDESGDTVDSVSFRVRILFCLFF